MRAVIRKEFDMLAARMSRSEYDQTRLEGRIERLDESRIDDSFADELKDTHAEVRQLNRKLNSLIAALKLEEVELPAIPASTNFVPITEKGE